MQADGNAAAACHLIAMTEQAEARHVGAGVDIFALRTALPAFLLSVAMWA